MNILNRSMMVIILLCSIILGQQSDTKKSEEDVTSKAKKNDSPQFAEDKILFNNETGNAIITITDEGSNKGSITLPEMSTPPSTPDDKLYNDNGTLKFNGSIIGGPGATKIDDLSDANEDGSSIYLGAGSGNDDDGTTNQNTALGIDALKMNDDGHSNTAVGYSALSTNVSGTENTAVGYSALNSNNGGYSNTAIGYQALNMNTVGFENTANGYYSLRLNIGGDQNTATGYQALSTNSIGNQNTAVGYQALLANTDGNENIATGFGALNQNSTGDGNTANGYLALSANVSGNFNTALGNLAGPDLNNLNNTTAIGYNTKTTADNQVRIGNSDVGDIGGHVDFSATSDGRYKRNVQENVSGLNFILGLRPVSYNLDVNAIADKLEEDFVIDKNGNKIEITPSEEIISARSKRSTLRNTGFIAQEVDQLVKDLNIDFNGVVVPENDENIYALRYSQFVVPLVKAVQEQQELLLKQKEIIENLVKRLDAVENKQVN